VSALDPIRLEVFRSRLTAIADEAGDSIERTAISPIVTESKDYSATILDAAGNLIVGGGEMTFHWVAATRSVRATLERFADSLVAGDVFLTNDPYNGGGLHANDVFVLRPVFWSEILVAWVATSSHLMDVGGMVMGSFAPAATDCYQEGLRIPPAHLLRAGEEVREIWDIFRTNIRLAELNEMDLRALIAGTFVAEQKLIELIDSVERDFYVTAIAAIRDLSERQMRARIAQIADGVYRVVNWTEWGDELYRVPCTLTVAGDSLVFDFEGASPQAPHYFNSQPYIIKSSAMSQLAPLLVPDLPYSEGLLAPIEVRCPEGTIVHAVPPAPINAGHYQVSLTATDAMLHCLRLALWASSPEPDAARYVMGREPTVAMAMNGWSGIGIDGRPDTWIFLDCTVGGGSGSVFGDGEDLANSNVGPSGTEIAEVEILESSYPVLIKERGVNRGVNGAGRNRSGGGRVLRFEPYGTDVLEGQLMGTRRYFVCEGVAGGSVGSPAGFFVHHEDGEVEPVPMVMGGLKLQAGQQFEVRCASGGGLGDPLDRDPQAVSTDVAQRAISVGAAAEVYGVVIGEGGLDTAATDRLRADRRRARLRDAQAPRRTVNGAVRNEPGVPLYPGIVRQGRFAVAEQSGAVLAESPDHWTDGCPVLVERRPGPGESVLLIRTYLDPATGAALHTEVCPDDEPRSFDINPAHWVDASHSKEQRCGTDLSEPDHDRI
jgi:N-methylhydantoinase B